VLTCDGPSSRRLLRRAARRGGLHIERELIVLPSTSRPVVVLDDEESAVRHFWSSYATVPPGMARGSVLASPLLSLARLMPWRWTGVLAPGRVLVGSKR
jgi:hypothetical protein